MRKTAQTQTGKKGEVLASVEAWSWGVHLEAIDIQIETSCNNLYSTPLSIPSLPSPFHFPYTCNHYPR